jgi:AcrR family transcriptional regulator
MKPIQRTAGPAPEAGAVRNKRAEVTIAAILAATEAIVLSGGAERISISDVCAQAGVSRGTFYRYFVSQDELLDAFARHKRSSFHQLMLSAVAPYDDPDQRFYALVRYLDQYAAHGQARQLLRAAPEYTLRLFSRLFNDSLVRIQEVLAGVFDAWDERLGIRVDRELVGELLIRCVLSELVVPNRRPAEGAERTVNFLYSVVSCGRVKNTENKS